MPQSPSRNHTTTSVAGGSSAEPTPANNVGGGSGWGDPSFQKGGVGEDNEYRQGPGHMDVRTFFFVRKLSDQIIDTDNKSGKDPAGYDGLAARSAGPEDPCREQVHAAGEPERVECEADE